MNFQRVRKPVVTLVPNLLVNSSARKHFAGMAQEVGGKTGSAEVTNAQTAAGKASTNAQVNMNMSTYTKGGADGAK